jgi:hypothetical protein
VLLGVVKELKSSAVLGMVKELKSAVIGSWS